MPFCNVLMLCGQGEDVVSHCTLSVSDEPKVGGTFVVDSVPASRSLQRKHAEST